MINIVGVEFKSRGKTNYFITDNLSIQKGTEVIAETERGLQFGKVVTDIKELEENTISNNMLHIIRIASKDDYYQHNRNLDDAKKVLVKATKFAKDLGLEMNFMDVCYTFDRNQLILYFLAESRVDFRELARQLAAVYKTRIELRQIGVRDKAKEVSGIGPCGRQLCCSSFLNDLDTVSISMAKNQNLALNPTKINGLCGRLLCCLNYEDDQYSEYRQNMPEVGENVKTEQGEGQVISIDILGRKYCVFVENVGKVEVKMKNKCDACEKCNK